jgi:fucose permease
MTLAMVITPLAPSVLLVTIALLSVGVTQGVIDTGGVTLVIWGRAERSGPFLNGMYFFAGVGGILAPLVVGWTVTLDGGARAAYWALAGLILPAAVWLFWRPSPPIRTAAAENQPIQNSPLLVGLFGFFLFIYVGIETSVGGWYYTYLMALKLEHPLSAAYLNSGFWIAVTAGRLLVIPLAKRLSPTPILAGNLLLCLVSVAIIGIAGRSIFLLWTGTFGLGLSLASIMPMTLLLGERSMHISGRITGSLLAAASLGGMLHPWLVGQLTAWVGISALLPFLLVNTALAVLAFSVLLLTIRRQAG